MNKICGVLGAALLLGTAGCSSDSNVDIGDGKTGEKLSDYSDTWEGYAEAYTFADGSDKIAIVLDENGEGLITFGEAAAPTTTDAAHPPRGARWEIVPGFSYRVQFPAVEANRLRFRFDIDEVLTSWCELQSPYSWTNGVDEFWMCLPNGGTRGANEGECWLTPEDTGIEAPVDCASLAICQMNDSCKCTADSCTTPPLLEQGPALFAVDGALRDSGDSLEGTLRLGEAAATNPVIRLTRQ